MRCAFKAVANARPCRIPVGLKLLFAAASAVLFLLCDGQCASAQADVPTEYQMKAAFLFNFAKFIDWPENGPMSSQSTFSICILGPDSFRQSLDDAFRGKSVENQPVAARRIKENS
jgi:hypothetical protein